MWIDPLPLVLLLSLLKPNLNSYLQQVAGSNIKITFWIQDARLFPSPCAPGCISALAAHVPKQKMMGEPHPADTRPHTCLYSATHERRRRRSQGCVRVKTRLRVCVFMSTSDLFWWFGSLFFLMLHGDLMLCFWWLTDGICGIDNYSPHTAPQPLHDVLLRCWRHST